MKEARISEQFIVYVICAEGIVGAGTMQEEAIDAGRIDDNGVGGVDLRIQHHAIGQMRIMGGHEPPDGLAEKIIADFAHKPRADAQLVEGQTHVRNWPTRGKSSGADLHEMARRECLLKLIRGAGGEIGDHVQAKMPGDYGVITIGHSLTSERGRLVARQIGGQCIKGRCAHLPAYDR